MEQLLRGLLQDLERRCVMLCTRLSAVTPDADINDYMLRGYQEAEQLRRATVALLADPSLDAPILQPNYLRALQELDQKARLIESYVLPFVERFAAPDRRMTRLCRRLTEQVQWPLPAPLVVAVSQQYYWTLAPFNLVCASATEETTLLGIPDLCHELGHILLLHFEAELIGDFVQELVRYIEREQRRVQIDQRAPVYQQLYDLLFAQWRDEWLREFVSDMVATYLIGPAFGWQHVRLGASFAQEPYHPTLGEKQSHPADEARLRSMVAVLAYMGETAAISDVQSLWNRYVTLTGKTPSVEYEICYPQHLITSLAQHTVDGCRTLGLRSFNQQETSGSIVSRVNEAWRLFLDTPHEYPIWERATLQTLWQELGVVD